MKKINPFEDSIFSPSSSQKRLDGCVLYPKRLQDLTEKICHQKNGEDLNNKIIMVSSAEAGYGKSHLIYKAVNNASASSRSLNLKIDNLQDFSFGDIFKAALRSLYEGDSIRYKVRELFSKLICDLINKGVVPVANKDTACRALQNHYINMLDTKDEHSLIAKWFNSNINALFPHLVRSLSNFKELTEDSCKFWIQLLYECESYSHHHAIDNLEEYSDTEFNLFLKDYQNLFLIDQPLIIIFDNIDNIFFDREKGPRIANLLIKLSESDFSSTSILSVNDDLWASSFKGLIPSALKDRINESNLRLDGLDQEMAKLFIAERMTSLNYGKNIINGVLESVNFRELFSLALEERKPSPRKILRIASKQWEEMESQRAQLNKDSDQNNVDTLDESSVTVQSIKKMMRAVNDRNKEEIQRTSPSELPIEIEPVFKEIENNAPDCVKDFAQHRDELYFGKQSLFDIEALKYTLKVAGNRSPIIDFKEFKTGENLIASSWHSNEIEFIFGFEPPEKTSYWIELLKQSQKSNAKTSKIISFSPSESDNYETSDFDEIIQDQINIIQLPREDLASLAAGNTVIQESDDEGKIFSQIAPELDAIWKKITKTA